MGIMIPVALFFEPPSVISAAVDEAQADGMTTYDMYKLATLSGLFYYFYMR